jgi:hypothetical protein
MVINSERKMIINDRGRVIEATGYTGYSPYPTISRNPISQMEKILASIMIIPPKIFGKSYC